MNKKDFLTYFIEHNINISLYDFRYKKSKYGNEIWFYKKDAPRYGKQLFTGYVFVDDVKYKYKSKEYFDVAPKAQSMIKEYKIVYRRQGTVLEEEEIKNTTNTTFDVKDYFY